jgi:hypothetical protein
LLLSGGTPAGQTATERDQNMAILAAAPEIFVLAPVRSRPAGFAPSGPAAVRRKLGR